MIPLKKSNRWISVFIFYSIVIFTTFIITRVILNSKMSGGYISIMLFLSLGSALLPCIAGYFGKRIFFNIYSLSAFVGILYMLYVVIGNTSPGWGDLTSLIGYMFIVGIGIIIAFVSEVVFYVIKTK